MKVFSSPPLHGLFREVQLIDDTIAQEDVRTYLNAQFQEIKETHRRKDTLPALWPSPPEFSILQYKSSGHFIYPKVVISIISADARPSNALQAILGLQVSPQRIRDPLAELDELFRFVIDRASERVPLSIIQRVLGFLSISKSPAGEFHPDILEEFLELEEGDMDTLLSGLASLLSIRPGCGPMLVHKSFSDFLFDESRAAGFSVQESVIRAYVWTRCCELISRALKQGERVSTKCWDQAHSLLAQKRSADLMTFMPWSLNALSAVSMAPLWARTCLRRFQRFH
jgi:hypothetical protein